MGDATGVAGVSARSQPLGWVRFCAHPFAHGGQAAGLPVLLAVLAEVALGLAATPATGAPEPRIASALNAIPLRPS